MGKVSMDIQQDVLKREIELITLSLEHKFEVNKRKVFLQSLNKVEKQKIFDDMKKTYIDSGSSVSLLVKRDLDRGYLNGTHSGKYLNDYIPDFEKEKAIYVQEKLKEKGLI